MNSKGLGKKRPLPNLMYYPGIHLEGLRKTTRNLSEDNRSAGRDLNLGPLEHESEAVTNRPRRSVEVVLK
jgi:hypothetical protein